MLVDHKHATPLASRAQVLLRPQLAGGAISACRELKTTIVAIYFLGTTVSFMLFPRRNLRVVLAGI